MLKFIYIHNKNVRIEGPHNGRLAVDPSVKQSTDTVLSVQDAVKMVCGAAGIK
jgi:hypothetical protein